MNDIDHIDPNDSIHIGELPIQNLADDGALIPNEAPNTTAPPDDSLVQELAAERQQRLHLQERLARVEQNHAQTQAEREAAERETRMAVYSTELEAAYAEGDMQAVVRISRQLADDVAEQKIHEHHAKTQTAPARPSTTSTVPTAQQQWIDNTDWFHNPAKTRQKDEANLRFNELIAEGFNINDPATYQELDKRLTTPTRRQPPPTHAPDRGGAHNASGGTRFTPTDADKMRGWGLDPNNPQARQVYLNEKAKLANNADS